MNILCLMTHGVHQRLNRGCSQGQWYIPFPLAVKTVFLFEVGVEGDRSGPPARGGDGESEWWLSLQDKPEAAAAAAAAAAAIDVLTVITDERGDETFTDVVAVVVVSAVAGDGGITTWRPPPPPEAEVLMGMEDRGEDTDRLMEGRGDREANTSGSLKSSHSIFMGRLPLAIRREDCLP